MSRTDSRKLLATPYLPASIECRVFQVIPHGSGPLHGTWIIGEVLVLHLRDEFLAEDGLPDTARINPVARMGRSEWAEVGAENIFQLQRPTL